MQIISESTLKRFFANTITILVGAPGVVGVFVTLFPPNGAILSFSSTVVGLFASSTFLLTAWIIWKWSHSCLPCQPNLASRKYHH